MKTVPLNHLFDVEYGNKFDLNKMELLPKADGGIAPACAGESGAARALSQAGGGAVALSRR